MFNPPGVYRREHHPDVASLGAPKPLFVQQCGRDNLYSTRAMERSLADLAAVYEA